MLLERTQLDEQGVDLLDAPASRQRDLQTGDLVLFKSADHLLDCVLSVFTMANKFRDHGIVIKRNFHALLKAVIYSHPMTLWTPVCF